MTTATLSSDGLAHVGMGQIVTLREGASARTVLGSCVGLSLWHPRLKVGALAHIVLPNSNDRQGAPGKFADTALPYMVEQLSRLGAPRFGLRAKLAGGSNMFGSGSTLKVGAHNAEAVRKHLADLSIPIDGEHLGGKQGRRITFDTSTGSTTIEIVGQPKIVI